MTTVLHDHIHLFAYTGQNELTGGELDASDYHLLMPGMDEKLETATAVERGLTGVAHIYRVLDDNNNPKQFSNGTLQIMATTAEKDALKALSGKSCWLALNDHDDDPFELVAGNGYLVVAVVTGTRMVNAMHDYWHVFVQITDVSS
jgi:hypothetical protein